MKRIAFFITHKTLGLNHAEMTFGGISRQECDGQFDELYIYNSHSDELSNDDLLDLYTKYDLGRFFKEVKIFPYISSTPKTLGADISAIKAFCNNNFSLWDHVLIIKSDTIPSVNFFDDIFNLPTDRSVYFVAPFICAKKRVSDEDIIEYTKRKTFIRSDEITFFVEDQHQSTNNDFNERDGLDVTSNQILFTSCYVIRDFSCHYFSMSLFDRVRINSQSWGGVWFSALEPYFHPTDRSFVIHKFHDIVSENRSTDREGPVKLWLDS